MAPLKIDFWLFIIVSSRNERRFGNRISVFPMFVLEKKIFFFFFFFFLGGKMGPPLGQGDIERF